ncbi:MAG TPA: hypothetical protein VMD47_11340 [Candidatus Acidoferrales bacterium]|nr:hypothetical protein [Candidatus Acidoferrales bacterium]
MDGAEIFERSDGHFFCSNYPLCTFVVSELILDEPCPSCGSQVTCTPRRGLEPQFRCATDPNHDASGATLKTLRFSQLAEDPAVRACDECGGEGVVLRPGTLENGADVTDISACEKCEGYGTVRKEIACISFTDEQICYFESHLGELDSNERGYLAMDARTPGALLVRLAGDRDYGVRKLVSENPACPPEALLELATDRNQWTRRAVAMHPRCPSLALIRVASDRDLMIGQLVLDHVACPPEALKALATVSFYSKFMYPADFRAEIRQKIASHGCCPPELLRELARDPRANVRRAVAQNNNCPKDVLAQFLIDADDSVRYCAKLSALSGDSG